jgi:zinc protease
MINLLFSFLICLSTIASSSAFAVSLVSDETIEKQTKLTKTFKLSNGIEVIQRSIPASDILTISVTFGNGIKDIATGKKSVAKWLWATLPMASKKYPKKRVFQISEKYAIELGCSAGIEYSSCTMGTINDNWNVSLDLFNDLIMAPSLTREDASLSKERIIAGLKDTPSDPGRYVNEVVNRIFYPKNHPYRLNHDESLKEMDSLTHPNLKAFHKRVLNAKNMRITVVSSLSQNILKRDLERAFGKIKSGPAIAVKVDSPKFDESNAFSFEAREIPTAYIRAKFVVPPAASKDAVAAKLMFEILSEELGEEIRTRRSLSYSVFSYVIHYSMGIGVIGASTSKPKETLEAMQVVIDRFKKKVYSKGNLDEYKRIFATGYFLTQETHSSLASAINGSRFFHGSVDSLYNMPKELEKVTPKTINRIANEYLNNFRIGVIYDRKKFKDSWAKDMIKKYAVKK